MANQQKQHNKPAQQMNKAACATGKNAPAMNHSANKSNVARKGAAK